MLSIRVCFSIFLTHMYPRIPRVSSQTLLINVVFFYFYVPKIQIHSSVCVVKEGACPSTLWFPKVRFRLTGDSSQEEQILQKRLEPPNNIHLQGTLKITNQVSRFSFFLDPTSVLFTVRQQIKTCGPAFPACPNLPDLI